MFLAVSVLAGVLTAGLAVPAVAFLGVSGTEASKSLTALPIELETPPAFEPTTVYLANGEELAQFFEENRVIVGLDEIAQVMKDAQLAIEDYRFYEHGPIDLRGTLRAFLNNAAGGDTQGGSTLTQQYVKQVLIETAVSHGDEAGVIAAQENTLARKVREMRYAIALENRMSKDEIFNGYLNIAYYGDGAYGVEAAAMHYFGIHALELNLAQAAMLAGIVQTPGRNPIDMPEEAIERRNVVINRMLELDYITEAEAEAAKLEGYDPSRVTEKYSGCTESRYPFICDYVVAELKNNEALGADPDSRMDSVNRSGFKIQTYIDPTAQEAAQKAVSDRISATDPVVSTMVELEPGTGLIVAMAQNRVKQGDDQAAGETWVNPFLTADEGFFSGYQPGSTMKPFVAAAALDAGIPSTFRINSPAKKTFTGTFKDCDGNSVGINGGDPWPVENSPLTGSTMTMQQAVANSVNTYFVQLELKDQVTPCRAAQMAETLGVTLSNPEAAFKAVAMSDDAVLPDWVNDSNALSYIYQGVAAFVLGAPEVTPLSMAEAYATFASGGIRCEPIIVKEITARDGSTVPTQGANCQRVISQGLAEAMNSLLQGPFNSGTATSLRISGYQLAGKTGTTDNAQAVSFVGYSANLVGVAMVTGDSNPFYQQWWRDIGREDRSMEYLRLPGSGTMIYGTGASDAGPIWRAAMTEALATRADADFTLGQAGKDILNGKRTTPPKTDGMSETDARAALEAAGFRVEDSHVYNDSIPQGQFIEVGSCEMQWGGTCTLVFSQGPRPAPTANTNTTTNN